MLKIIDIDELFDKYISDFVYQNIGKLKPEEIENQIPKLYEEFGDKKLKELDDFTPNTYYLNFDIIWLISTSQHHTLSASKAIDDTKYRSVFCQKTKIITHKLSDTT